MAITVRAVIGEKETKFRGVLWEPMILFRRHFDRSEKGSITVRTRTLSVFASTMTKTWHGRY